MNQPEKILFDNRIKRKNVLALNEKVAAIREFLKTPVYKHVGRSFSCSPDQIKRIIQQKDEILKAWEQRTRRSNEVKSLEMKSVRVSMLGKSVYEWIRRMMYYKDFLIKDALIQKMALQFKSALGIQVFFPHQDWCDKFRNTYKINESDTKKLNIAYTQGHSVQIKDIIRDVLGTCTPDRAQSANAEGEEEEEEAEQELGNARGKYETDEDLDIGAPSDNDIKIEVVDEEEEDQNQGIEQTLQDKYKPLVRSKRQLAKKQSSTPAKNRSNAAKATSKTLTRPKALATPKILTTSTPVAPKRHLVAVQLPMGSTQHNGMGRTQKVLVATPITQGGANVSGGPPMTMTIIPLTSVQSCAQPPPLPEKPVVPPPKLEIKSEIFETEAEKNAAAPLTAVTIKKEYMSDDEDMGTDNYDEHEKENNAQSISTTAILPSTSSSTHNVVDKVTAMETELSEEEDNLVLAQLQKGLGGNNTKDDVQSMSPNTTSTAAAVQLPAMPPLTRAPTSTPTNQTTKRQHAANQERSPPLPSIRTCAEARKYMKLLEDFALVKENFRLIGLITRADEVLREMDCDDDTDV